MEKFVQLSFSVPKPSKEILDSFIEDMSSTEESTGKSSGKLLSRMLRMLGSMGSIDGLDSESSESKDLAIFPIIEKDLSKENLKKLVKMAAPFFDYNTRRLKQYINSVRLQTYIAYYAIGVPYNNSEKNDLITIEQLGKFIALILKYPRLRLEIEKDDNLLADLEKLACQKPTNNEPIEVNSFQEAKESESTQNKQEKENLNYWIENYPKIAELLRHKLDPKKGEDYIFKDMDIKSLLVVSSSQTPLSPIYFKLRDLLAEEKWKEADEETKEVMLKVGDREEEGYLTQKDIENFPREDLVIIDTLWMKYSDGQFGFSVQKEILQEVEKESNLDIKNITEEEYKDKRKELHHKWGERVGWRQKNGSNRDWIYHNYESKMTFNLEAPPGHFPRKPSWNYHQKNGSWLLAGEFLLLSRLDECK